jgi:formylglycine-generating enzyme required for sulfatase activity
VLPGPGKRIVWEAGEDLGEIHGDQYQVKVVAGDAKRFLTVFLPGNIPLEMVWIPPGQFVMGSPRSEPGRHSDEGPQHLVAISRGFYLGKYEITQAQWQAVMGTAPWGGGNLLNRVGPDYPAVSISWEAFRGFCHRLNQVAGDSLYRMPTEAEWEYACRARTTTPWSFGDEESRLGEYAWYEGNNNPKGSKEVGQLKPNPWGLYDMHGNVWEWVYDWGGSYSSAAQTDPTGPSTKTEAGRVRRGGVFQAGAQYTRSAERAYYAQGYGSYVIGARLVRIR